MKKPVQSQNLNRRGLLVGLGTATTLPLAGIAEAVQPAALSVAAPREPLAHADTPDLYRDVFLNLLRIEHSMRMLVADAFERAGRKDVTADEALFLYKIDHTEYRAPTRHSSGHRRSEINQLNTLWRREYISGHKPVTLSPKGKEVADFVTANCMTRLDGLLRAFSTGESLPRTVKGLKDLDRAWRDVVLYRL